MARQILGIMTRHIDRGSIEEVADTVAAHGLGTVQLSLESSGLEPMPPRIESVDRRRIAMAFRRAGVSIAAVSGTFNVIDPDRELLRANLLRFAVVMAFEPETANVVDTLERAQALIEAVRSPALGVTFDPANFFYPADLPRMTDVIREGFSRLGRYIALAHAKDVIMPPDGGSHCRYVPAGRGLLDYNTYLTLLSESGYTNGLILHSLSEADIDGATQMISSLDSGRSLDPTE